MTTCTVTYVYPLDWLHVATQILLMVALVVVIGVVVTMVVTMVRRKPQPQPHYTIVNNASRPSPSSTGQ